jgi:hypothetical protein
MAPERLEVLWDYFAFPVWGEDGASDPIEIEISPSLRGELKAWSDEWTAICWGERGPDMPDAPVPTREQYRRWWRRGRALAERLQAEVGEDFEVVYGHREDRIEPHEGYGPESTQDDAG